MITLSDLLLKIVLPVIGFAIGIGVGKDHLGLFGAIAEAAIGLLVFGYLGTLLDRLHLLLLVRGMRRKFAPFSVDELRNQLGTSLTPNFILLELKARGKNTSKDIEPVLRLLEADESFRRCRGYAALLSAFPQIAASIRRYNPMRPVSECHEKVAELRHQIQASYP